MGRSSIAVAVTSRQRELLEALTRTKLAAQQLVERCHIVLMSAEGRTNEDQADELGVDRQRVRRWRHRWARARESLAAAEEEGATGKDLEKLVIGVLMDDARSGARAPATFSPEQVIAIIALACEPPGGQWLAGLCVVDPYWVQILPNPDRRTLCTQSPSEIDVFRTAAGRPARVALTDGVDLGGRTHPYFVIRLPVTNSKPSSACFVVWRKTKEKTMRIVKAALYGTWLLLRPAEVRSVDSNMAGIACSAI